MAAHRGHEVIPERHVLIKLDLEIQAVDPGMLPQEAHSGQQGFLQAHKETFLLGLVADRGEGAPHLVQGELEDVPENAFLIGEILVEGALGDAGLGHQAVERGGLVALLGELRPAGVPGRVPACPAAIAGR